MNNDRITTLLGCLIGAVIAANVNFGAIAHGDMAEVFKAVGAVAVALQGFFTNKQSAPPAK